MLLIGNSFINNNMVMSFAVVFVIVFSLCLCAFYMGAKLIVLEGSDSRFIDECSDEFQYKMASFYSGVCGLCWERRFASNKNKLI
jgi:hypothetical protein